MIFSGKPNVSVYLLDEPSSYACSLTINCHILTVDPSFLDSEQRIIASKVIKRYVGPFLMRITS